MSGGGGLSGARDAWSAAARVAAQAGPALRVPAPAGTWPAVTCTGRTGPGLLVAAPAGPCQRPQAGGAARRRRAANGVRQSGRLRRSRLAKPIDRLVLLPSAGARLGCPTRMAWGPVASPPMESPAYGGWGSDGGKTEPVQNVWQGPAGQLPGRSSASRWLCSVKEVTPATLRRNNFKLRDRH